MADVPIYKSRWQLKKDESFRIRINLEEIEGKRVHLTLEEGSPHTTEHWVEFKMWDYATMIALRKKATRHDKETNSFYVDSDLYNNLKIKHLLKDWSFGHEDSQMKIHHVNNVLTDESMQMFNSFFPWIANAIIFEMNKVLEGFEYAS